MKCLDVSGNYCIFAHKVCEAAHARPLMRAPWLSLNRSFEGESKQNEEITNALTRMIPRLGHIVNYVNGQRKVGQTYGGLDIIYTDRQLVLDIKEGA